MVNAVVMGLATKKEASGPADIAVPTTPRGLALIAVAMGLGVTLSLMKNPVAGVEAPP